MGATNMLNRLLSLFKKKEAPPKWRLVPDEHGTYTLEKRDDSLGMYISEAVRVTPDEACEKIAMLEGKVLYYREEV